MIIFLPKSYTSNLHQLYLLNITMLQDLGRKGIPEHLRGISWQMLSGTPEHLTQGVNDVESGFS